eukprot:3931415-Amphidinium_carterae.1
MLVLRAFGLLCLVMPTWLIAILPLCTLARVTATSEHWPWGPHWAAPEVTLQLVSTLSRGSTSSTIDQNLHQKLPRIPRSRKKKESPKVLTKCDQV